MDTQPLPNSKKVTAANVPPKSYSVVTGFNYGCTKEKPEGTRVEPGKLTIELPPQVLTDLLAQGVMVEGK